MKPEIYRAKHAIEEALRNTAKEMCAILAQEPSDTPLAIGLCGGRSVVGLLKAFQSELTRQSPALLKRLHFLMVDERIVPLESKDSNFGGLQEIFFKPLVADGLITNSQLHAFQATSEDARERCDDYMQTLSRCGGAFSVVVLGMGEDGHIAGLFPEHRVFALQGRGFFTFFDSPKPPAARMTASRELILEANLGVLLVLGEGKLPAWVNWKNPLLTPIQCPGKLVESMRKAVVVTDLE